MRGTRLTTAAAAALATLALLTGCAAPEGQSAPEAAASGTPGGRASAAATSPPDEPTASPTDSGTGTHSPGPGHDPQELAYAEADERGLLRTDAVEVQGPSEVRNAATPQRVRVRIALPSHRSGKSIEVVWSGDCRQTEGAKRQIIGLAPEQNALDVTVSAQLPAAADSCYLRADALFTNKPYTGSGVTVTLRR